MARASFEYDEVGNTFYYVLVSFYALVLIPLTYYFFPFPNKNVIEEKKVNLHECQCHGCDEKRRRKEAHKPWRRTKKIALYVVLIVAWAIFAFLVKKMTEIEVKHEEYNPYSVLGLDQGASNSEIKKAYRELSKVHHPDRGGDPIRFDQLAKAYQALTEEEARKNWELYGNPDGPQATTFGIALPKWLVSEEYGLWVLAFYGFILIVVLPVVVGIWWYNSIKYSVDKVLLDTTQLFYYFIHRTPRMEINRMLMVLSASFEFFKQYNKDIVERETDNVDLPRLMKSLPNVTEKSREQPLGAMYAVKARILMHAYLTRIPLESEGLEEDQRYILSRLIRLIEEMVSCSQSLNFYSPLKIPVETFENFIRLMPMFVQALWPKNSPLLQLPHITEQNLTYCRKSRIFTCSDLASMQDEKRRALLRSLSDSEYRDVLVVLASMPRLEITPTVVVEGEDDAHEVTAGCYVTLKVHLKRTNLMDPIAAGLDQRLKIEEQNEEGKNSDGEESESVEDQADADKEGRQSGEEQKETKPKRKPWEKAPQKKKGSGAKKKAKQQQKKQQPATSSAAATAAQSTVPSSPEGADKKKDNGGKEGTKKKKERKEGTPDETADSDEEGSVSGSDSDILLDHPEEESGDEDSWVETRGKKVNLETKSHQTHPVHSPHYPSEKFEWWWLMLTYMDKKEKVRKLVAPVVSCKTLTEEQTVELRFPAPSIKGIYTFALSVKSDSYMDADFSTDLKLEVKEERPMEQVKYEDTEDESEEKEVVVEDSDEYTEGDSDDE